MTTKPCAACKATNTKSYQKKGVNNLWSQRKDDFKKLDNFSFTSCRSCGLIINEDYKSINFHETDYSHVFSDEKVDSDYLVGAFVKNILDSNNLSDHHKPEKDGASSSKPCWIEVGCGKRINYIMDTAIDYGIHNFNLMDPLYESPELKEIILKSFKEKEELFETLPRIILNHENQPDQTFAAQFPILIARNSLEYMNIDEIKNIFRTAFKQNDGAAIFELTFPSLNNKGDMRQPNLYSEYQTFLSPKSIKCIFDSIGLRFMPKINSLVCGDQRNIIAGTVKRINSETLLHDFNNVQELNKYISEYRALNKSSRIVMIGAGARNLMYVFNEGYKLIDLVVDNSQLRVGLEIPGIGTVSPHSQIEIKDLLVLLNASFVEEIRKNNPENNIALINQSHQYDVR